MPDTAHPLIQELTDPQLPALAYNKRRLGVLLDRPNTNLKDLGQVFLEDPGLTLRLLRELGRFDRGTQLAGLSPAHAIGLLGITRVQGLVRGAPTLEERYQNGAPPGLRAAYARALHAARFAERLAVLRGKLDTDEDMTLALLQGLGELLLWARKPTLMRVWGEDPGSPGELDGLAWRELGLTLGQLGEALARGWGLHPWLQQVQHFAHLDQEALQLPLLAAALAREGLRDWQSPATEEILELAAEFVEAAADPLRGKFHKDVAEIARVLHALDLPHGAERLLWPPGTLPPPPRRSPFRPAPPPPAPEPVVVTPATLAPPPPAPAPVTASEPPKAASLHQQFGQNLRRMRDELGLRRLMFAMLTPDRQWIRARYVLEEEPSGLAGFAVAATERNLFSLLLHKPHALWVHQDNHGRFLAHIPAEVLGLLYARSFYAVSAVVKERPIGLFYGDMGDAHAAMQTAHFEHFRHLCQESTALFGG